MVWGLTDRFVDEVIAFYPSRAQAVRALKDVIRDEPEWEGMLEVVPVPSAAAARRRARVAHRPRGRHA